MDEHIESYIAYLQKAVKVGNVVYNNIFDTESEVVRGLRKSLKKEYQKPEQLFYAVEEMLANEISSVENRLEDLKKPKEATFAKRMLQKAHLRGPEKTKSWVEEKKQAKALTELKYLSSVMLQTVYMNSRRMAESGSLETEGKGLYFFSKWYPKIRNELESCVKLDPKVVGKIDKISNKDAYQWLVETWKMDKE